MYIYNPQDLSYVCTCISIFCTLSFLVFILLQSYYAGRKINSRAALSLTIILI